MWLFFELIGMGAGPLSSELQTFKKFFCKCLFIEQ